MRAFVGSWLGSEDDYVRFMERAYAVALDARPQGPADHRRAGARPARMIGLELDEAELLITRALELAGESGSVRARMSATLAYGWFLRLNGELDAAETVIEEVRATAEEFDLEPVVAASLVSLGWIARRTGRPPRLAEKLFREAVRVTSGRAATAGCCPTTTPPLRPPWPISARSTRPRSSRSTPRLMPSGRTRAARCS